jgi:RsiW-degrading membrane proteinase PrsW (M82 family)
MGFNQTCPYCNFTLTAPVHFCPNCGEKLIQQPVSLFFSTKLLVYFISVLLPPLGLWYGFKYLRQKDKDAKQLGLAAVILTTVSLLISLWIAFSFINNLTQPFRQSDYQHLLY